MRVLGLLRVKNEARWIERALRSIMPLCELVIVMDDHSTDETAAICAAIPEVTVLPSPFSGLDEIRDKNWLLDQVKPLNPEFIVFIDGDEILAPGSQPRLLAEMQNPLATCLSLRILYLWNDEQTVRMDGVYGDFHRESVFRPNATRFVSNGNGGHFHCGNVPAGNRGGRRVLDVPLLHLGYMDRADRERKWKFYTEKDPGNTGEDNYRHITQGDPGGVPAELRLMHAGPIELRSLQL